MKHKNLRHDTIKSLVSTSIIRNQDELLQALIEKGFELTQATLSRDLKQMKVAKQATEKGEYIYVINTNNNIINTPSKIENNSNATGKGFFSIDFSGNQAVIKTRPGYASSIASDIDTQEFPQILGSIAGDDTVLLIIREEISKEKIIELLSTIGIHF